jgi:hypothetical protein
MELRRSHSVYPVRMCSIAATTAGECVPLHAIERPHTPPMTDPERTRQRVSINPMEFSHFALNRFQCVINFELSRQK